jgi:hypothetical protein
MDTPVARYQEYPCQFSVVYGSTGSIDAAVLGNSRGMLAIDATLVQQALSDGAMRPVVTDLSKSWRGAEFLYQLGKDLLSRHPVKLLLVEFNLAKSEVVRYHERTPFFLRTSELLRLAWTEDRDSAYRRASRLFRWLLDRFTLRTELLLTGKLDTFAAQRASAVSTAPTSIDCPHSPPFVNAEANLSRRESYPPDWQKRRLSWDPWSEHQRLNTIYLERVADEARRHDTKVVFFHVPEYLEAPLDEEFVARMSEILGAPLLVPPLAIQETLYQPGQFHDPTHLTPPATRIFSEWLGGAVRRALEQGGGSRGNVDGARR